MASIVDKWAGLHQRIQRLHASGRAIPGAISDLSGGEATIFFDDSVLRELSQWIHEAHQLAVSDRRDSIVADLAEAVREWVGACRERTLYEVGVGLTMADFCVFEEIEIYRIGVDGERRLDSIEDYADPIDARYRLQRFISDLMMIADMASMLTPASSLSILEGRDFCTREELAQALGVKPQTITKWISAYRRKNKKADPSWVRRRGGQQRGFQVKVPTFLAELRAGRAY